MVAPYAQNDVYIAVDGGLPSGPYVEMTTRAMGMLGVDVLSADGDRFVIPAGQRYRGRELEVEPDASAATYFWAAAAITGGRICITGLTRESLQGDVHFVEALERMGAVVEEHDAGLCVAGRPARPLRGITIDLNRMPDTVQTLAVTALFAEGSTEIRNVANLRVKETDRIAALASELSKLGAGVTVFEDGLRIDPPAEIRSAAIETFDDHRMAMSFTLAGLVADGVVIRDGQCVSKSFPAFFEVLNEIE
jgi:3-phosphoshikimate 1-carboxyvinyltransferase